MLLDDVMTAAMIAQAVRRKVVGAEEAEEILLTEDDPARFMTVGATKDNAFVTVNTNSKTSCEVIS